MNKVHPDSSSNALNTSVNHDNSFGNENRNFIPPRRMIDPVIRDSVDHHTIDVGEERNFHPNVQLLQKYLLQNHPSTKRNTLYTCSDMCTADSGFNCLCGTSERTDFDQFGIGISLYFRYLQTLICFFFMFTIMVAPSIYFSFISTQQETVGYQQFNEILMGTSVGNLGLEALTCQKSKVHTNSDVVAGDIRNSRVSFSCSTGYLANGSFRMGLIDETFTNQNDMCEYINPKNLDNTCNLGKNQMYAQNKCGKQKNCEFIITTDFFQEQCHSKINKRTVYVSAYCSNSYLDSPVVSKLDKSSVILGISLCDSVIVILFIIFLICLQTTQKKTMLNVIQNSMSASLFTIELRNLPPLGREQLTVRLWKFLQESLNTHYRRLLQNRSIQIYDIQIANTNKLINTQQKKGNAIKQKKEMMKKFILLYDTASVLTEHVSYNHLVEFTESLSPQQRKKARTDLIKLKEIQDKIKNSNKRLSTIKQNPQQEIFAAWITFDTIFHRNLAWDYLYSSPMDQFCFKCCFCINSDDHRNLNGQMIQLYPAPEPSNILWKNLLVGNCNQNLRKSISILVTLFLLIITVIAVVFVKREQQNIMNKNPIINCTNELKNSLTQSEVIADYYAGSTKKGYIECYCQQDIVNRLQEKFPAAGNRQLCQEWFYDSVFIYTLPYIVIMGIIITNYIMQFIFEKLSEFEKHQYKSNEVASRIVKIFFIQFINTGLIILIMNARISNQRYLNSDVESLLSGKFDDFTPLWFKTVGTTIILTMIIYIFLPIIELGIHQFLTRIQIRWDQRCQNQRDISRKLNQKDYQQVYLGPQFQIDIKYAKTMSLIFITFFYCSGLPLLCFSSFLNLLVQYWVDKYLLLRCCKNPNNFDDQLETMVRKILWIIIPIHLLLAIWIYGNPYIFVDETQFLVQSDQIDEVKDTTKSQIFDRFDSDSYISLFGERAVKPQNYIHLALLGILFIIFALQFIGQVVINPILKFLCCCWSDFDDDFSHSQNDLNSIPFQAFLEKQQIYREIKLISKFIQETSNSAYKLLLIERKRALLNQKQSRLPNGKNALIEKLSNLFNIKLIGLPSYDIRNNPIFLDQFALNQISLTEQDNN